MIDLTAWKRRIPAQAAGVDHADALLAAADLAEMEAIRTRQSANRHKAYASRRPTRYATAAYAALRHPHQDPRGMVSSWWTRGPRVLILAGPSRTGKTFAAYAIANAVHDAHLWVVARSAADLSAALKPQRTTLPDGRTITTNGEEMAYNNSINCDLLLLDDLGRERVTDWWLEQLQRIIDDRCGNMRRLIVTANANPNPAAVLAELASRYGDPLAERLLDGGGILGFDGPAVREVTTSW